MCKCLSIVSSSHTSMQILSCHRHHHQKGCFLENSQNMEKLILLLALIFMLNKLYWPLYEFIKKDYYAFPLFTTVRKRVLNIFFNPKKIIHLCHVVVHSSMIYFTWHRGSKNCSLRKNKFAKRIERQLNRFIMSLLTILTRGKKV